MVTDQYTTIKCNQCQRKKIKLRDQTPIMPVDANGDADDDDADDGDDLDDSGGGGGGGGGGRR